MVGVLCSQRDRFRFRVTELEEELAQVCNALLAQPRSFYETRPRKSQQAFLLG